MRTKKFSRCLHTASSPPSVTGDSKLFDYIERALLNGIIGNQNRLNPSTTSFIYMLPLGANGMQKPWGASNRFFPCCWGTLSEELSKFAGLVYAKVCDVAVC